MDSDATARPRAEAWEPGLAIANFVISLVLIASFVWLLYYPTTAEYQDDLPGAEDLMSIFLFLFFWLPLFGFNCVLTLAAIWSGQLPDRWTTVAALVNAGFICLLSTGLVYVATH